LDTPSYSEKDFSNFMCRAETALLSFSLGIYRKQYETVHQGILLDGTERSDPLFAKTEMTSDVV